MDYSRLSDEELIALSKGNLAGLSDESLKALASEAKPKSPGFGNPRDLVSGINRNIAGVGDSLVAWYNLMLPKSQEVQPLSTTMKDSGVDLERPRSYMGMAGEYAFPGPGGVARNIAQTGLAAAGGYAARQAAPDSVLAEMAGAIAAPVGAGLVRPAAAAATRGALRGSDATVTASRVALADSIGAPSTVGTATNNPLLKVMERLSGSVPGGVTPFRKAGEEAARAIKAKLESITGGAADDIVKAGRTIQRGLFDPDTGWTKKTMDTRNALYGKLDDKLSAQDWWDSRGVPEQYSRTVAGAPERQKPWPKNLWEDPADVPAAPALSEAGVPRGFPASNTRQFVASANKGVRGAPELSEALFVDKTMQDYFTRFVSDLDSNNGKIPYEAIKKLRTEVGDMLGDPQLIGSGKRDLLGKFYKSLSDDMRAAADKAGALKEFERANAYHKARIERIEDFYDTLYKKTTPEDVWSAVIGDNPRSASRLSAIRKGLTPQEWGYLRKTVVTRMGKPVASAAKEGQLDFSAGTFLTNYERMKGTNALSSIFGNGQYRKDLDQVARYASDLKSSAEVLANPSGTAGLGLAASVYYGALGMAAAAPLAMGGSPIGLVSIGGATVANSVVARLMNNQRFVHWLARSTKIPPGNPADTANHLKRLALIVGNDPQDLEDVQEFLSVVSPSAE